MTMVLPEILLMKNWSHGGGGGGGRRFSYWEGEAQDVNALILQFQQLLDQFIEYVHQEIAQRVGAPLPQYITYRSRLGHLAVFTGMVELAGIIFTGEPAKNKKQAEKNAALAAWTSFKQFRLFKPKKSNTIVLAGLSLSGSGKSVLLYQVRILERGVLMTRNAMLFQF